MTLEETQLLVMFARVVEMGSFTAAAQALGVSKALVSGRLAELERRLGVKLLHRNTRRLSLTTDGSEVYERCARMVVMGQEALALANAASDEPQGMLRVSSPVLFGELNLGKPLAAFARAWPSVRVEVVLKDSPVDLASEQIDVAIHALPKPPPEEVRACLLAINRRVLCATPEYLARQGTPTSLLELGGHRCLRYTGMDLRNEWTFQTPEGPCTAPVSGSYLFNNVGLLLGALREGLGLGLVVESLIAEDLEAGRLVRVLPEYTTSELRVYALHAAGRVPAKVRIFVDLLAQHMRGFAWNKLDSAVLKSPPT